MSDVFVGYRSEFEDGSRKLITNDRFEIGVFRVKDEFYAFLNSCPHQGGPVCQGRIMPKVEEHLSAEQKSIRMSFSQDEFHLVCPWHGYEFRFSTGKHPGADAYALRRFETRVEEDKVYVRV